MKRRSRPACRRPGIQSDLNIGQPQVIGPLIGADRDRMATAVVGAIDQQKPRTRMSRISPNGIFCGRSIIWANRPLPTASSLATSGS